MENQPEFVNGLIIKPPRPNAPEFVKGSISIKREELMAYLAGKQDEWINVDIKVSKKGGWYCQVNNWKPNQTQQVRQDINEQDQNQQNINNFDQNNQPNPQNNAF